MAIFLDLTLAQGAAGVVPVGMVAHWAGAGAPVGWLVRDGSTLAVADYPQLHAVIGYTYGGAGANFMLPDDRGLVDVGDGLGGALPGLTNHVLGAVFGEESHVLTVGELATHTHVQDSHTHVQDAHTHTQNAHTHTQDSHNHTQDAHTHTQNSHNHTQDSHTHTFTTGTESVGHTHGISTGFANANNANNLSSTGNRDRTNATDGVSASHTHSGTTAAQTATNQAATATNQNATATNQAATATNQNTTATNQNTTATNQGTVATNQNTGSSTAHNNIQPSRYYTPIIKY